ncbi:MAG TPA: zinc-binding dehydrogenase [Thermoanaerobaculia bacterium]|nr:zinc-binding dehydrogenase [Thermoanaerobaculia bacterium]
MAERGRSRAWIVEKFGGPERLTLSGRDDPSPGRGEVRLRTAAIGLNFADLFVRAGAYPNTPPAPMVPGMEISGVIDAVGAGVDGFEIGQRAVAVPIFGGHAESVVCPAERVFPIPDGADLVEAAALPVAFLTADYALSAGDGRAGERLVVTAAAGGVGSALLQLAGRRGLRTLALVGSEAKLDLCRRLGAEAVGLYGSAEALLDAGFEGRADLVVDAIGGRLFRRLWRRLDRGGRYVLYGFAAASRPGGVARFRAALELAAMGIVVPYRTIQECRTLVGFNLSLLPGRTARLRESAREIFRKWRAGEIAPILGPRFSFERLPDAHRALAGRATTGKVLVVVRS